MVGICSYTDFKVLQCLSTVGSRKADTALLKRKTADLDHTMPPHCSPKIGKKMGIRNKMKQPMPPFRPDVIYVPAARLKVLSKMADRPPKAPGFHVKLMPPTTTRESDIQTASPSVGAPPDTPWANKFAEFSRAKRAAHRSAVAVRSTSPMDGAEFDRLDDDLLMSMFPDKQARVVPELSEHNSNTICEVDKKELDDADSSEYKMVDTEVLTDSGGSQIETASPSEASSLDDGGVPTTDPKRVKRILANRQSAQRSRVRKLHYISELERNVQLLQSEVTTKAPRVAYLDHQRTLLTMSNGHLRQKIAAVAQDAILKRNLDLEGNKAYSSSWRELWKIVTDTHDVLLKEKEQFAHLFQQQQQNAQKMILPDDELDADLDTESITVESNRENDLLPSSSVS